MEDKSQEAIEKVKELIEDIDFAMLTTIAGDASRIGLPKLYAPTVTGAVPGPVRFRARLSSPLPWTVEVYDAAGGTVASSAGLGPDVDWSWDASLLPSGTYTYAIRGDDAVTPAVGTVGAAAAEVPLAIAGVAADPETVSPNGDEIADLTTITYTLTAAANVTVIVRDDLGGEVMRIPRAWRRAAEHAIRLDPSVLVDGYFDVEISAVATGGRQATATTRIAVTRTLGGVQAVRTAFSPNADGRADRIAFRFELASPADVRLRILKDGKWVATPFTGPLEQGARILEWDGAKRVGKLLDGSYEAVVEATDAFATASIAVPFASDTRRPKVRILNRFPLRVWVSEPAKLTLRFGGRNAVHDAVAAGAMRIPGVPRKGLVRAVAWDSAGRLWETEHGRSGVRSGLDEINLIEKGANYGWPTIEGDETQSGMRTPVLHSTASITWAPASLVYMNGSLFFGGLMGQSLYEAKLDGTGVAELKEHFKNEYGRIRTVRVGPDNMLYITTSNTDGRGSPKQGDDKIIRINPNSLK